MKRFLGGKKHVSESPQAIKALEETAQACKFIVWFDMCENTRAIWFSHLHETDYKHAKTPAEWLVE